MGNEKPNAIATRCQIPYNRFSHILLPPGMTGESLRPCELASASAMWCLAVEVSHLRRRITLADRGIFRDDLLKRDQIVGRQRNVQRA